MLFKKAKLKFLQRFALSSKIDKFLKTVCEKKLKFVECKLTVIEA